MICSMTGFGRAHGSVGERWGVDVLIRSVNHRFLDLSVRLREDYAELEPPVRRLIAREVARGKVEASIHLKRLRHVAHEIQINEALLEDILERFSALSKKYPVAGRLEVGDLLTVPEIVRVETESGGFESEDIAGICAIVQDAMRALVAMRETEGRLLVADLLERIAFLKSHLDRISASREEVAARLHANLKERLALLFADAPLDRNRLEQEAAVLADRSDISEEITRLASHLEQIEALLQKGGGAVGKKLDFLTQEIHREINTLGAKSRDLQITRDVLEMKTEAEKIRGQVQNIE